MDRQFVYPGAIPLETDLLNTNRNVMIGLGKLIGAILGTSGVVNGLTVGPNTPAALNVIVSGGEIYQLQNVDNNAYSTLPADTTDTCVKQGVQLQPVTLACAAPGTAGYSINYLIEATFAEVDGNPAVLPYYNASNPTQAYSGPNNSGAASNTVRQGQVSLQAKAGIAATTGTQTTPAVDAGYVALAVVTVANGQTTIVAGNIAVVVGTQVLSQSILAMIKAQSPGRLLNVQVISSTSYYTPTPGTNSVDACAIGGGGGGGGVGAQNSTNAGVASGGGGGGFARSYLKSGFAGALVTIGAGGAGGASGANGGQGGQTSFGSFVTAGGGGGGLGTVGSTPPYQLSGGAGGVGTGGNIGNGQGGPGGAGTCLQTANNIGGSGGGSFIGYGGGVSVANNAGANSVSPGGGGGGAVSPSSGAVRSGGYGSNGTVIVFEYS